MTCDRMSCNSQKETKKVFLRNEPPDINQQDGELNVKSSIG